MSGPWFGRAMDVRLLAEAGVVVHEVVGKLAHDASWSCSNAVAQPELDKCGASLWQTESSRAS